MVVALRIMVGDCPLITVELFTTTLRCDMCVDNDSREAVTCERSAKAAVDEETPLSLSRLSMYLRFRRDRIKNTATTTMPNTKAIPTMTRIWLIDEALAVAAVEFAFVTGVDDVGESGSTETESVG